MSTIQENLDRIQNAKSAIKDAIIQKGIEVTDTEKIETYADKILQIKSGGGTEIPEFDPEGPLTIYCLDDWGDAHVKFNNGYQESTIQYSTDGSTWKTYTDETIKLTNGQYVQFKGVITQYAGFSDPSTFILKDGLFNLYGNLTSLDNYISTYNGENKYNNMFANTNVYDCSKLNTGIKTFEGDGVFAFMFENCKYLVKVPELPVTTLANSCYSNMFSGCTLLTTIPSNLLPATTLANSCYSYMFQGCTLLNTIPNLPATTLANSCYQNMFQGCTGLTTIPSNLLPATTLADRCYSSMFSGCTSLTTIPGDLLPATTLVQNCYLEMFKDCTGLTTIPSNLLPATTLADRCYSNMFSGCQGLTTIPSDLLPATTLLNYCYRNMFSGCTGLTTIPSNLLPATTLANRCYLSMFQGCTGLTTIPNLPATTLANRCYSSMFQGCTSLTTIPSNLLPATTLANSCYQNMFQGCTGLTTIPEGWYLPAQTTIGSSCSSMFANCYKLHKMAVSYSGTITADHWSNFLDDVSSTGTFFYSKNQTKENIQSIVPSGWTLVQSTEW